VREGIPKSAVKPLVEYCQKLSVETGRPAAEILREYLELIKKYADFFFSETWTEKPNVQFGLRDREVGFIQGGKSYRERCERFTLVCLRRNISLEGFDSECFNYEFKLYGSMACGNCPVWEATELRKKVADTERLRREIEEEVKRGEPSETAREMYEYIHKSDVVREDKMMLVKLRLYEDDGGAKGKSCEVRNKYKCPYGEESEQLIENGGRVHALWQIVEWYDNHWNPIHTTQPTIQEMKWYHYGEPSIIDVTSYEDIMKAVEDGRLDRIVRERERYIKETQSESSINVEKAFQDAVLFVETFFNFHPTEYQAKLFRDKSKRIVVRWSRQSGKTTTIALRAIWYAVSHKKTLTLIVAPSLRQSMIMSDRISDFLGSLPPLYFRLFVKKLQRTVIQFTNGSRIIALPNSPQLLRGYTANQVICDESAFFREDELVFYNVLYPMLATTDGILIASSTPWSKDSVFYKMCNSPEFKKHLVTCDDAVKAGLIPQSFIDEMRLQLPVERFQREFESQFVEDVDAWLPQSLIVSCIDAGLQLCEFQDQLQGDFYVGVDFGKQQDYSVICVIQKKDNMLNLIHIHRFPLQTEYASVIGYIKSLSDRWQNVNAVYADVTGVGDYIVEDMVRSGVRATTGVKFTVQSKEEMATILRETMKQGRMKIPYEPVRRREDIDLCSELNVEKYELMKTGHIKFSHPEGSHDDVFWSSALACFASVQAPLPGKGAVMLPH